MGLVVLTCLILISSLNLQHEDKEDSPIKEFYEEHHEEAGPDNLVEAILLDYRAYDTFGEVMVLYIAITGVLILGKKRKEGSE
ncbi:MAG: hydrogen gas-evolving membrane-bound hydrogenase subunit E [Thermoplasmata archaeon]